jgi:hypothetical protein
MQITLNFPVEAGITQIKTTGDAVSENFTTIANDNFIYTKTGVVAGDYFINFELYCGDILRTVVSELVLVRSGLTSSKTITLVGENLKPLPTYEIIIDPAIAGIDEWELTEQTTQATPNIDKVFTVSGTYAAYRWYLDGVPVGTASSYTFNKQDGVYQLVVVVTDSNGESRSGRCRITVELVPDTISPILSEDFEGATHLFTIVNGSQANQWWVGTAAASGGTKSAYISNTSGSTNAYNISSTSVVHIYRDVIFPASTEAYTLSFDWRVQGESSYDYLRVRLIETSTSVAAGSQPSSGTILGTYNSGGATTWNRATINIPTTNSGTTKRLVFTWVNDNSAGTQPPAAVDNILLTGNGSSAPTTYTVTFNVNSGSGTVPVAQTVNAGSGITLPSGSGLTRSGYTFGGWNTNAVGTGTNYNAGSLYTPTITIMLYAKWYIADGTEANPFPLTINTWFNGTITSTTNPVWYSFPVTSGTTYRIWWNDSKQGNSTKTGDVAVSARYQNASTFIFGGTNTTVDNGWTTAQSFTANQTGTVYIRVTPYNRGSSYTGTYGIAYSTGSARPEIPLTGTVSISGIAAVGQTLTANTASLGGIGTITYQWKRGTTNIGTNNSNYTVQTSDVGYTITVTVSRTGFSGSVTSTPTTAVPLPAAGTPDGTEANPFPLTMNTWADGSITAITNTVWYSFPVTSGTTYRVWWNDSYEGNSTKSLDVKVSAVYSGGASIFADVDSGWSTARSFTATQTGTIKIKVVPYSSGSTGTFAVAYSTSATRP